MVRQVPIPISTVEPLPILQYVLTRPRLTENFAPLKVTAGSVGLDLCSIAKLEIQPRQTTRMDTGVAISPPIGHFCKLQLRSSLALKGLQIKGTVIDADYRSPVLAILTNDGTEPVTIEKGQRVVQLLCLKYCSPYIQKLEQFDITTLRNQGGFGSTGI